MSDVKMDFKGFDDLMKELEQLGRKANPIEKIALEKAALPIEKEAKSTVAWKDNSGTLRKTIEKSNVKRKKGISYIYVGAGGTKELEYAWMLEFGTSKMQARPYLGPAFEMKKPEAMNIMQKEIKEGLGL